VFVLPSSSWCVKNKAAVKKATIGSKNITKSQAASLGRFPVVKGSDTNVSYIQGTGISQADLFTAEFIKRCTVFVHCTVDYLL
jgi:hypothetical protein